MYQILRYRSSAGDIEFSNKAPIILQNITGLSETKANNITTKFINQDGESYKQSNLENKEMIISFAIVSNSNDEYMECRDKILRIVNPKLGEAELVYLYLGIERTIKVILDGTPSMPMKSSKNFTEGEVTLIAHKPYFEDLEIGEQISTWIGGMKWKFSLPFRMKQKGESKRKIYNEGHVDTPVKIYFKGPAVNPSVINHTTGEFIKVNRTLSSDDTLIINTEFGNKTVEIERNGVVTNAFHYIDLDSTFFNLEVGDNLIEYTTENDLTPQSVEVKYNNRYLGI